MGLDWVFLSVDCAVNKKFVQFKLYEECEKTFFWVSYFIGTEFRDFGESISGGYDFRAFNRQIWKKGIKFRDFSNCLNFLQFLDLLE